MSCKFNLKGFDMILKLHITVTITITKRVIRWFIYFTMSQQLVKKLYLICIYICWDYINCPHNRFSNLFMTFTFCIEFSSFVKPSINSYISVYSKGRVSKFTYEKTLQQHWADMFRSEKSVRSNSYLKKFLINEHFLKYNRIS